MSKNQTVYIDSEKLILCQTIIQDIKNDLFECTENIRHYESAVWKNDIRGHIELIDLVHYGNKSLYAKVGTINKDKIQNYDIIIKNNIGFNGIVLLINELSENFSSILNELNTFEKEQGYITTSDDEEVVTLSPEEADDVVNLDGDPIIQDGEDDNITVEEIDDNQNNNIWNDDLLNGGLGAGIGSGVVYPWANDWNNNWDNTGNNNPWDQNWNGNGGDPIVPNPTNPDNNDENNDDGKPKVEFVNIGPDQIAIETPLVSGIGGGIIGGIGSVSGSGSGITKPEFNDPTENKKEPNINYGINDMELINPAENDPRFMDDDLDTLVDDNNVDNLDDNITDSSINDSINNNEENNSVIDNDPDILNTNEVDNLDTETESGFFKTAGVSGIGLAGLAGVGLKKDKDKEKKKNE